MKIIVAGSRTITSYNYVEECIEQTINTNDIKPTEIVSGGARGPDKLGETWAIKNNVPIKKFPANWERYGISAGYKRNKEMADYGDVLIAIWDGKSSGTKNMIDCAKRNNLLVFVFKK